MGAFTSEFEVIAGLQHKLFRKIRDLKLALNLDTNRMERMQSNIPVTLFQPGSSRTVSIDRQLCPITTRCSEAYAARRPDR